MSLFYTDHLVSIILFNYDSLNSMTILLFLCFYSLYYNFVNLNIICNNNNNNNNNNINNNNNNNMHREFRAFSQHV